MNFFGDLYNFFGYLGFVDIVFLVSVIAFLILLVTLVYFIRINRDDIKEDNMILQYNSNEVMEENKVEDILKIKNDVNSANNNDFEEYNDEEGELLDLETLTKKLKAEENVERIDCDEYEKDQEEKAIISYAELLEKKNKYTINYEKEEVIDDVIIKKVNLNDLVNKNEEDILKEKVRVISYDKEEAFLSALKELNRLLN